MKSWLKTNWVLLTCGSDALGRDVLSVLDRKAYLMEDQTHCLGSTPGILRGQLWCRVQQAVRLAHLGQQSLTGTNSTFGPLLDCALGQSRTNSPTWEERLWPEAPVLLTFRLDETNAKALLRLPLKTVWKCPPVHSYEQDCWERITGITPRLHQVMKSWRWGLSAYMQ